MSRSPSTPPPSPAERPAATVRARPRVTVTGQLTRDGARLAVPVAPPETIQKLQGKADRIVCLSTPADFYAVGQFYRDFPQVDDDEVIACLAAAM